MESLIPWLLAAHIAVLGYWLGSEFVINSEYRYVCYRDEVPFSERQRMMDHVLDVDQHVRYALVLQVMLGGMIAALYGYFPGGSATAIGFLVFGLIWLGFVEVVHRLRREAAGERLAAIDRGSRYVLLVLMAALAFGTFGASWPLPFWLRLKLGLFACVILCGVGIRLALIGHFQTWALMAQEGATEAYNSVIRQTYVRATSILVLLWVFIAAIAVVSISKP